ncbi:hypothetical protein I4U23_003082 [Adineta vaga]|nr:hypothetical protein I4U23_003082 [Adineta vaga]
MNTHQTNYINRSTSSGYSYLGKSDDHRTSLSDVPRLTTISKTIAFRVCRIYRNPAGTRYIRMPDNSTLDKLKQEICIQLDSSMKSTDMTLTIFDEDKCAWIPIDETIADKTIADFQFPSYPIVNIEKREETSRTKLDLTLKLCRRPMNKSDFIYLELYSTITINQLKDEARKRVTTTKTNYLYLWRDENWIKLETDLNDITLAELHIIQYTIISFEPATDLVPGVCGLTNLGNTCFMNSALQCLSNIPELNEKILSFGKEMNAPIIGAYSSLIKTMWLDKCAVTTPSSLLLNIRESLPCFPRYKQHDAQEFMNYFLHLIHQELTNETTLVTQFFLPLPVEDHTKQYNILYLRSNGEQSLESFQSSATTIEELEESFIRHSKLDLFTQRIVVARIINNRIIETYRSYTSINATTKHQLVFIELPEKTVEQKYIEFRFLDRKTLVPFRPPVYIVCPLFDCRYSDISEQIKQIQDHFCAKIGTPLNAVDHIYWTNYEDRSDRIKSEVYKNDPFLFMHHIAIEMDSLWIEKYQNYYNFDRSTHKPSLTNLLADFFREEQLDGDYYCSKCLTLQKAKQKADLVLPLPHVLIIQLKRFTYEAHSDKKINTYIDFPLKDLDLTPYVIQNSETKKNISALYDLVAVSNHTGTLFGGHYTTYAKNHRNHTWYCFNDEIIREITNERDVITENAYILVYTKRFVE